MHHWADQSLAASCVCFGSEGTASQKLIGIFTACVAGICSCAYQINNENVQLRPCRFFSQCFLRGEVDPDWEFLLRGICFGFRVIDDDCVSCYQTENYKSIMEGETGAIIAKHQTEEIASGILTVVIEPCLCCHSIGRAAKGPDDFRAINDCSTPESICGNDHTQNCCNNFSYNSVESVSCLLWPFDWLATVNMKNAYRAVSIHSTSSKWQDLSWKFDDKQTFMRDNRRCIGLNTSPFIFTKLSNYISVACC